MLWDETNPLRARKTQRSSGALPFLLLPVPASRMDLDSFEAPPRKLKVLSLNCW
jgi:hypothetical protein